MSDEKQIVDIITSHLNTFTTTITRSVDHLMQQNEKQSRSIASNANDIARLEAAVENLLKVTNKQSEMLDKAMNTAHETAISMNSLSNEYRRLEFDRAEVKEEIQTVYKKMDNWQKDCSDKYKAITDETNKLKLRVSKIYWIAATVAFIGTIAAQVIGALVNIEKITG